MPRKSYDFLRDGVTGNMSGFELEDEGSTPSPAANFLLPLLVVSKKAALSPVRDEMFIDPEVYQNFKAP